MLNVAERKFEYIQGILDQCVRFKTARPINNAQLAEALEAVQDPSGLTAPASLIYKIVGEPREIDIIGIKVGPREFGVRSTLPHYLALAEKFAERITL